MINENVNRPYQTYFLNSISLQATTSTAEIPKKKDELYKKTLDIYFSLHVVKETYLLGIVPWSTEYKIKPEDCKLNSPLHDRIVQAIHKIFEDLMLENYPNQADKPHEVHVHPSTFVKDGNYLSLIVSIQNSDGTPISKNYQYYDKPASRKLWKQVEAVVKEAATYEDFETRVDLEKWIINSITIVMNVIKNVNCLWNAEEIETFLERVTNGLSEIELDPPLEFISIEADYFLKFRIDVFSPNEDVIEAVKSFSHMFQEQLLHRSINGTPSK